jgi:hypothetical protein
MALTRRASSISHRFLEHTLSLSLSHTHTHSLIHTCMQARKFAEADAFWCFMELISEFRDHFCQQLDNAETGIRATLRKLMMVLRHADVDLWRHIEVTNKVRHVSREGFGSLSS